MLPNKFRQSVEQSYILEQIIYADPVGGASLGHEQTTFEAFFSISFTTSQLKQAGLVKYLIMQADMTMGQHVALAFFLNDVQASPTITCDNTERTYIYTFMITDNNVTNTLAVKSKDDSTGASTATRYYNDVRITAGRDT